MKEKHEILIFVEHRAREFDIACLIKHYLEELHGYKSEVLSTSFFDRKCLRLFDPIAILVPYCYSYDSFVGNVSRYWPKAVIVNMRYEQVYQRINEKLKELKDDFSKKSVFHHAWGPLQREDLLRQGADSKRVRVFGNFALSLYNTKYSAYFTGREQLSRSQGLDLKKKWVFIPENYGAAFYSPDRIRAKVNSGMDQSQLSDYMKFSSDSLKVLVEWCEIIAERTPEVEIIIRPRPETPVEKIRSLGNKKCKNLHFIKDYTVREWVLASEVVISSYSTTLIEGSMVKKKIFMFEPIEFPEYVMNDWYRYVERIRSVNEFEHAIESTKSNHEHLLDWINSNLLLESDPIYSFVNFIHESIKSRDQLSSLGGFVGRTTKVCSSAYRYLSYMKSFIDGRGNERLRVYDGYDQNDFFSKTEVVEATERWKSVLEFQRE